MTKKYSLLFPGQGSQYVGMGQSFLATSMGKKLGDEADSILGFSLTKLMLAGPIEKLTKTAIAQPAILLHSMLVLQQANLKPVSVLGHSLGEYSALVAAEVISFADAIKAVHMRGKLMQEAVPPGMGTMAAVLGLEINIISQAMLEFNDEKNPDYAAVANFNSPLQTVISGTKSGIEKASLKLKALGAKRIVELAVSAPFHCALMNTVQKKMAHVLSAIKFNDARVPVVTNVLAKAESNGQRLRELLLEQIISPVRFSDCVLEIKNSNLLGDGFIEIGPKDVLSALVKKIDKELSVKNIDLLENIKQIIQEKP